MSVICWHDFIESLLGCRVISRWSFVQSQNTKIFPLNQEKILAFQEIFRKLGVKRCIWNSTSIVMRIAIISDIHSNLEALQKAFEIIEGKNVDEIVCMGDIVGYGADPNRCLELVRQRTRHILLGNHDEAAIDLSLTQYFNQYARRAAYWTNENLTEENINFLRTLPLRLELWNLTFVHSTPRDTEQWDYIFSAFEAHQYFDAFNTKICFVGHSHVPGVYCEDGKTHTVKPHLRYIINVGSIGQPRDGDPRLSFGIFDTETWKYEHVRSEYDAYTAATKILQNGLPRYLAERLLVGI